MFHSFFNSLARSRYLFFLSHSVNFTLCFAGTVKSTILQILSLLLIIIRSGCLGKIRWSVFMSKSQSSLCVSFSGTDSGLCIYHLFVWSNFNFLHISQSCQVLYPFCVNLLHSFIMWLIVSSLSPHNRHLQFCCVLSILSLVWLAFMAVFCTAMRRNSVSLLGFPFLSHDHVFSCEMLLVSRLKHP